MGRAKNRKLARDARSGILVNRGAIAAELAKQLPGMGFGSKQRCPEKIPGTVEYGLYLKRLLPGDRAYLVSLNSEERRLLIFAETHGIKLNRQTNSLTGADEGVHFCDHAYIDARKRLNSPCCLVTLDKICQEFSLPQKAKFAAQNYH